MRLKLTTMKRSRRECFMTIFTDQIFIWEKLRFYLFVFIWAPSGATLFCKLAKCK